MPPPHERILKKCPTYIINWEEVLPDTEDVNEIFNFFYDKISETVEKHAPLRKLSKKHACSFAKLWITKGLLVSITKKSKTL
jgi:hypothetical protein